MSIHYTHAFVGYIYRDESNFKAVWTLSDHNATWSDITGVAVTCWYKNNNRLSKVASQMS